MKNTLLVCLGVLCLAAPIRAADLNKASLTGRVLTVQTFQDLSGTYRIDIGLFTQDPAGGPYSPVFSCPVSRWSDCEPADLITGCTLNCEVSGTPPLLDSLCFCASSFNPGAGACLKVKAFHDGSRLQGSTFETSTECSPVP